METISIFLYTSDFTTMQFLSHKHLVIPKQQHMKMTQFKLQIFCHQRQHITHHIDIPYTYIA